MKPIVIFVHPTLSLDFTYNQVVKQQGFDILTVVTSLENTKIEIDFIKKNSRFVFMGSDSPQNDIDQLKKFIAENKIEVFAVVNGIDSGIYYTDFLQKELLGYDIDLDASKTRLNKFNVNNRLEQHHLVAIPSVEITSKEDLKTKMIAIKNLGLPIVAKPSEDTAAMSAFEILYHIEDIPTYLDKYLGKTNAYYCDQVIKKIILQKYISLDKFEEFAIDFVSYQGRHYCCGILHYDKSVEESIYKLYRCYRPYTIDEIPQIQPVVAYINNCLTALDVRYGFTHNEVFWDKKNEYYLIESNNRMAGNGIIEAYHNSYGYSPLSNYIKLLKGKSIETIPSTRKSYSIPLDIYNTSTDHANRIHVEDLESFQRIIHFRIKDKNKKDFYKHYTRADTINAAVLLNNASQDKLQHDINTILEREKNGTLFSK